jgi:GTP cyclohydrolase II
MRERDRSVDLGAFGAPVEIGATRAIAEFHARRPLRIAAGEHAVLALPVDGLDHARLAAFRSLCAPAAPALAVTAQRARALGIGATGPVRLLLDRSFDAETITFLASDADARCDTRFERAGPAEQAAIRLAKMSQRLPAVLVAHARRDGGGRDGILDVDGEMIDLFRQNLPRSLTVAGKAMVPLKSGSRAEFVIFRDPIGGASTAVVVGRPDPSKPVLVRLHSACLTGDVFGSRRCDCGDQLELAIQRLEAAGAGIVLYLAQEGRGVGLANKMRAYQMQDDGLDTVDANTSLGFEDDERDYGIAARMLQLLGCRSVVLLTNNPAKLDGLAEAGVSVVGRVAIETPVNADNFRYLAAKAERAGHRLDQLLGALGKPLDTADEWPVGR